MTAAVNDFAKFGLTPSSLSDAIGPCYGLKPPPGSKTHARGDARLVVLVNDAEWVDWILLRWRSHMDDADVFGVVAHGCGFAGSLRECRHTYFGEPGDDGYVFYVEPWMLTWAFEKLAEYFDFQPMPPETP